MKTGSAKAKKLIKKQAVEMPASLFLKKEMVEAGQKAVVYNLEEEFHGTRKNRSLKLYLSLAVFSALLLAGTFGATSYIENRNRNIAINISDFEDINMQELLYALRNAGKLLADMRNNMALAKKQMELDKQKIRMKAQEDLELLKRQHSLSEAERAAMMKKILTEREKRIAAMNAEYDNKLKDKEKSVEDVKLKMGDYKVQLQQKMDTYVAQLETRLKEYQGETKANKAKAEALVQQMGESYRLKREEEKKEYEKKILDLTAKMKKAGDNLKASTGKADELQALVNLYRRAMAHYAFMRGEQGHVISVQKDGRLLVVLNPLVEVKKSGRGLVIDNRGAVIARIEMTPKDNMTSAQVVKKLSGAPINPFDIIIVQKE